MAYLTSNEYKQVIYSGDSKHRIRIWFNNVELENADYYCEKLTRKPRILPDDGSKRFSLDNFVSQEAELILHHIDSSILQDQVRISIGTVIGSNSLGDIYEDVPIGIFNIQDTPTTDKDKVTITLRDNRVKFDTTYNAEPLIKSKGGSATKMEILQDICEKVGIECDVEEFLGMNDRVGIYDNTITATTYVSYLAEQAGCIPTINREGHLTFVQLSELATQRIPLSIVEKYEMGDPFEIQRVVYEDGIRKYQTSFNEDLDTLYINSANPYITLEQQINDIYNIVSSFKIDSLTTGKIIGDPAIDPYDIIEIYNDYEQEEPVIARTLANHTSTYNGVITHEYDTQIGLEDRQENITITGEATFRKLARAEIDNVNNKIGLIVEEDNEQNQKISTLEQSVGRVNSKVSDIADLTVSQHSYIGSVSFQDINQCQPIYIEISPTNQNNISTIYPSTYRYPSTGLYMQPRTIRFENTKTGEIFDYELPCDLYYYNPDIYDTFILDYNNHTCKAIKKCMVDADGNVFPIYNLIYPSLNLYPNTDLYPRNYPQTIFTYPTINLTDGDYDVYLLGYDSAYISVTLMRQNEYTKMFATHAELKSEIDQTADKIEFEVAKKIDENTVETYFDITADSITAKTGKFAIDADNYKLETDGTMTAIKGTISGFEFDNGKLTVDLTLPYNYNDSDVVRVQKIIAGQVQPTSQDYDKYDFIQNGQIDDVDLDIVQKLANGQYSRTSTYTLDTTNPIRALTIENGSTNTSIGAYSSYIDTLICDYLKANEIEMTNPNNNDIINLYEYIHSLEERIEQLEGSGS